MLRAILAAYIVVQLAGLAGWAYGRARAERERRRQNGPGAAEPGGALADRGAGG